MKFSIIIPTYNRASRISLAIRSVLAQDFQDWELVIIDDGSTDDTQKVVQEFAQSDSRIKYHWQENQERSIARNNGIQLSLGDYIMFLDSDDYFESSHLTSVFEYTEKYGDEYSFLFTNYKIKIGDEVFEEFVNSYDSNSSFLSYLLLNPIATSRGICKREILQENRFDPNYTVGEDTELWSRLSLITKAKQIPVSSYVIVQHDSRSIEIAKLKVMSEHIRTLKKMEEIVESADERKNLRRAYSYAQFKIGNFYHLEKKRVSAFKHYFKAFIIAPNYKTKEYIYQMYSSLFK